MPDDAREIERIDQRPFSISLTLSKTSLRLLGISLILLGATHGALVSSISVVIGVGLLIWGLRARLPSTTGAEHRWAAVASAVLMTGLLGRPIATLPASILYSRPLAIGIGAAACVVAFIGGHNRIGRRIATGLALCVAVLTIATLVGSEWSSTLGSDVYHAHRLAGAAVTSGQNPYTDAVQFADGNPFASSDRVIDGYPYPPVTLSAYAMAGAFTDPRLISAICWLAFLGWLAVGSWSTRQDQSAGVGLSTLLLMSLAPLASEVWYMAWTEPWTLLLFMAAAISWKRSSIGSGILLGLALASKQYLIFLLPLLLLHREEGWRRRSMAALITAGVTLMAGLLPGPTAFFQATIGNLTSIGFRPDTQSLPGLASELGISVMLPNWLWIGISLLTVLVLARTSRTRSGFMLRAGIGLGVAFLLGLAFPNYWFLVAGLLAIGTVLEPEDEMGSMTDRVPGTAIQGRRQETRIAGV